MCLCQGLKDFQRFDFLNFSFLFDLFSKFSDFGFETFGFWLTVFGVLVFYNSKVFYLRIGSI